MIKLITAIAGIIACIFTVLAYYKEPVTKSEIPKVRASPNLPSSIESKKSPSFTVSPVKEIKEISVAEKQRGDKTRTKWRENDVLKPSR